MERWHSRIKYRRITVSSGGGKHESLIEERNVENDANIFQQAEAEEACYKS